MDGFSARLTPSAEVERRAHVLRSGLAVTTPVAEAPPASSEPVPDALLPLGMLGGVWDRQTLIFPFEVEPLGNDVLQGSAPIALWLASQASC